MRKMGAVLLFALAVLAGASAAPKKAASAVSAKAAQEACENFLNDYTFAKYLKATVFDGEESSTFFVRANQIHGFSVGGGTLDVIFSRDVLERIKELSYIPLEACTQFEYRTGVLVLVVDASKL